MTELIPTTKSYTPYQMMRDLFRHHEDIANLLRWLASLPCEEQISVMRDVQVLCCRCINMGPKSALELVHFIRTQVRKNGNR